MIGAARRWGIGILGTVLVCCVCWPFVWELINEDPAGEAMEAMERQWQARGVRLKACYGDYVTQPDRWGGCECYIELFEKSEGPARRAIMVRAKRSWSFGAWEMTELGERPLP